MSKQDTDLNFLEFDLSLSTFPVRLRGQDGQVVDACLQELNGEERDAYLNTLTRRMKVGAGGKSTGINNFKDLQVDLLQRGLFYADIEEDDNGDLTVTAVHDNFKLNDIRAFPARVQQRLFEKLQQMSGLDDEAEEEAKED